MKKNTKQYFVASPDGFSIERDKTHSTPKQAWEAFDVWKQRFNAQGYYSTIKGYNRIKIPLDELKDACQLKELN